MCVCVYVQHFLPAAACILFRLLYFIQDYVSPGSITRALILSLSLCYHARLEKREEYEIEVVEMFTGPIGLPGGSQAQQFRDEIRW